MSLPKPLPSKEYLHSRLHYDPTTGVLVWKLKPGCGHVTNWWNSRFAGEEAGWVCSLGYRRIYLDGKAYPAGRVIWKWMTGEDPVDEVDHIDLNRDNNAWGNLRLASREQNCYNRRKRKKSGIKGVHRCGNRWYAAIRKAGLDYRLGSFGSQEEAAEAYRIAAIELHGEFANYAGAPQ